MRGPQEAGSREAGGSHARTVGLAHDARAARKAWDREGRHDDSPSRPETNDNLETSPRPGRMDPGDTS
jgi:hypothetical protein